MIGMIGERGVVDLFDQRMILQIFDDLLGVLGVSFESEGERLDAL